MNSDRNKMYLLKYGEYVKESKPINRNGGDLISFQMLIIISYFKLYPFTRMCSAEHCLNEQLQSSCGTNFKKTSIIYIMFNAYNGFSYSNNEKIFLQKLRKENQISPCHISCKQAKGSCIVIKEPRQRHLEKRTRTCTPFTIKRNRSPD